MDLRVWVNVGQCIYTSLRYWWCA